jgi:hypothetical protein
MKKIMFNDKYGLTKAVLEGRKTQTRRIINPQPMYDENVGICWKGYAYGINFSGKEGAYNNFISGTEYDKSCKRYRVGEIVAVAQNYTACGGFMDDGTPRWDYISCIVGSKNRGWSNKMFVKPELMPHQIKITNVRIERLQDISDEDCLAEGIQIGQCGSADTHFMDVYYIPNEIQPYCLPKDAYAALIDKVGKKGDWDSNPYVFVYDFELIK